MLKKTSAFTFLGLYTRSQRYFLEPSRIFWPTILQQSPRPFNTDLHILPCVSNCYTPDRLLPLNLCYLQSGGQRSGALIDKVIRSCLLQPVRPRFAVAFSPNLLISAMNTSAKVHATGKWKDTEPIEEPFQGGWPPIYTCLAGLHGHLHLAYMCLLAPIPHSGWVLHPHILSSAISIYVC